MLKARKFVIPVREVTFSAPPRWVWFNAAAFVCGWLPVVLGFTVRDHGTASDPETVFHRYTLLQAYGYGPLVLFYVGGPVLMSVVLAVLLRQKGRRRSRRVDRAAWCLAIFTFVFCLFSGLVDGLAAFPEAVLVVCAAATAPMAPDPRDRLNSEPGFFGRKT